MDIRKYEVVVAYSIAGDMSGQETCYMSASSAEEAEHAAVETLGALLDRRFIPVDEFFVLNVMEQQSRYPRADTLEAYDVYDDSIPF
jgi:hypothetical protein